MNWKILINTEAGHSKFWAYCLADMLKINADNLVKVRWGRLGTTGMEKSFFYFDVVSRIEEKINKGYVSPNDEQLKNYFPDSILALWEI